MASRLDVEAECWRSVYCVLPFIRRVSSRSSRVGLPYVMKSAFATVPAEVRLKDQVSDASRGGLQAPFVYKTTDTILSRGANSCFKAASEWFLTSHAVRRHQLDSCSGAEGRTGRGNRLNRPGCVPDWFPFTRELCLTLMKRLVSSYSVGGSPEPQFSVECVT